jgi:hypothetical protein
MCSRLQVSISKCWYPGRAGVTVQTRVLLLVIRKHVVKLESYNLTCAHTRKVSFFPSSVTRTGTNLGGSTGRTGTRSSSLYSNTYDLLRNTCL